MLLRRVPAGTYTLTYVATAGYQSPAPQTVTVRAGAATAVPLLQITQPLSEHLTLGNPSGATTDVNQPTNCLLDKYQYAAS